MGTFHLYVRNKTDYEVVSDGYFPQAYRFQTPVGLTSLKALFVALLPAWPLALGLESSGLTRIVLVIGALIATPFCFAYYKRVLNDWRNERMRTRGFQKVASIKAITARGALKKWALSDASSAYLNDA